MIVGNDTIASISTAMSDAGIGIIRVSGREAIKICSRLLVSGKMVHNLMERPAGSIRFGYAVDQNQMKLDEVLVSVMKSPHSYTGEDTVEINCHGGRLVLERVLQEVLNNGARLADPGEFSKRAFLNGKMDLTKAEAVMDIITAQNSFALENSEKQLNGYFKDQIHQLREDILLETAHIEAALDDPENDDLFYDSSDLFSHLKKMISAIDLLLDSYSEGVIRKEGIKTVILGKPNTGKSTLLNLLAKEEKAIVTDLPGTTRDIVEESVRIGELTLRLMDTAGIRSSDNFVEQIGVKKALKESEDADLILLLFDLSQKPDEECSRLLHLVKGRNVIILLNKADLSSDLVEYESFIHQIYGSVDTIPPGDDSFFSEDQKHRDLLLPPMISCSFLQGIGIKHLEDCISSLFLRNQLLPKQEFYLTSIRHRDALIRARKSLHLVKEGLLSKVSEEFLTVDLMNAYSFLGEIIGEEVGDDLVNEIFSKFCMGK